MTPDDRAHDTDVCAQHGLLLEEIREWRRASDVWQRDLLVGVSVIRDRLAQGDTSLATLHLRVSQLERIVYGAMAVSLTGLLTAIIALVIKTK